MKFREIQLKGFGRLVNRTFTFTPGFNLIFGPNETGKSTLQHAILALLYGFFDAGRVPADKRALMTAMRPWEKNAAYAGTLHYVLDNGERFQVSRTFGHRPTTKLVLQPDSKDISDQFEQSSYGRLFFADAQLGMSKKVFENTCTVRQAELVALDASAGAITDTLAKLAASASADTTTTDAITALDAVLRNEVGTLRASTKPLYKTQQRLAALERERDHTRQVRRELFGDIVELNQIEAQMQELEQERLHLRVLQITAEIADIQRQLYAAARANDEVERLAKEVADWEAWSKFPNVLQEDVNKLKSRREYLQSAYRKAEAGAQQAQDALKPIRAQMTEVETYITTLEDARDTPTETLPRIQALVQQYQVAYEAVQTAKAHWQKADADLQQAERPLEQETHALMPAIKLGYTGIAQCQQQILSAKQEMTTAGAKYEVVKTEWNRTGMTQSQFQDLERKVIAVRSGIAPQPQPRRGCKLWPFGKAKQPVDQTPAEFTIYDQVKPIYDHVIQAHEALQIAQETYASAESQTRAQMGELVGETLTPETFTALSQRLERYKGTETEVEQRRVHVSSMQSEVDAAQQRFNAIQASLRTELKRLGFTESDDPQADFERYTEQCRRKRELEKVEGEQQQLILQAQALERDIQGEIDARISLNDIEAQLCAVLAQADISCTPDSLNAALSTFDDNLHHHLRWQHSNAAYKTATAQPALMDAQTRTRLETSLARLDGERIKLLNQHPEWCDIEADQASHVYVAQQHRVNQEYASARDAYKQLQSTIQRTSDTLRHPAELEEEVSAVRYELERLQNFYDALESAITSIEQTAQEFQKQFTPKLEATVGQGLEQITTGRYTHVQVNANNLAVSLTAPEYDDLVSVKHLSTGTRDLVYLMLRIAIARLMSRTGEHLPLLLDDPLVQYDHTRQERALDFLINLASETQILFFTKDERTRIWFDHTWSNDGNHHIHVL